MEMTTPSNGHDAANKHIVLVLGILDNVRLVDVVGEDGGEGAHVAGHAAHESGDERGDAEAEQARAQVAHHHQRKHFVIAVQARARVRGNHVFAHQMHQAAIGVGQNHQAQQAGKNHDEGHGHLEERADHRSQARGTQAVGGQYALHDQKIRGPIAEADRESQAEENARPVNAHRVIGKVAHAAPHVRVVAGSRCASGDVVRQAWP